MERFYFLIAIIFTSITILGIAKSSIKKFYFLFVYIITFLFFFQYYYSKVVIVNYFAFV